MTRDIAFTLSCKLGIIYGTESKMIGDEVLSYMESSVPNNTPIIPIKKAAHHVLLDQPLKLVSEIKNVISAWK